MKHVTVLLLFIVVCGKVNAQTPVCEVPQGKIYQATIRSSAYRFDRGEYSVFIPDGIKEIRGVFIHQHGCTMEGKAIPISFDVQYQAFAKKWQLAVISPDLYPNPGGGCDEWRNPEEGSGPALLACLDSIARKSNHPELKFAPWLLWGHSGGGYWVLDMMRQYPDRILGVFSYSPAFDPQWTYPMEAVKIPLFIRHAGPLDFNNPGVNCWGTALHTFNKLRSRNGNTAIAYTKNQNHNFSYVRYMAIPFYEAVLAQRLPDSGSNILKNINDAKLWLGDTSTFKIYQKIKYKSNHSSLSILPDSATAAKWREYVMTGTVIDKTPPPAPFSLKVVNHNQTDLDLIWNADADIESGVEYFNIYVNNQLIGRVPDTGSYQSFDTNGDNPLSRQLPEMKFNVLKFITEKTDTLSVSTINHFGLESTKSMILCNEH